MDSPTNLETPELLPSGHFRHLRGYRRSPGGIEEVIFAPHVCYGLCLRGSKLHFCFKVNSYWSFLKPCFGDDGYAY